ncbi:hypothetical protein [Rhodomicrobium vannielii]|uniref:hypothetical protein n=1 Tax=Rhodomicrobium vannielii TaxID=1069 RepID=UPI00145E791A|nr:hypothetical protein [Rhodomicrobium vannielii]
MEPISGGVGNLPLILYQRGTDGPAHALCHPAYKRPHDQANDRTHATEFGPAHE